MRTVNEQDEAGKKRKGSFFTSWGCVLTVTIPIFLICFLCLPSIMNSKRPAWLRRAKTTLRSYGEVQLSYQQTNIDDYYGSWNALKKTGYISEGYTKGNIMENYSLFSCIYNPDYYTSGNVAYDGRWFDPSFTAVAFPRTTSPPGYLATFAIREDQILRMYRPEKKGVKDWGEDGDFGARTWQPIQ